MRRRFEYKDRELEDFLIRFYPAGNYTWIVPDGCFLVDVFLVGGGGGGSSAGGGGGYTKTFKSDNKGWKDGEAIAVKPGQSISITVGKEEHKFIKPNKILLVKMVVILNL